MIELKCKPRNVVKNSRSYYISLPHIWIRTKGIEKGDKVTAIIQNDGSLRVQLLKEEPTTEETISVPPVQPNKFSLFRGSQ